LTDDMLHDLDFEAVDWYIDRACADQGVKLLPPAPPAAPPTGNVPKSATHYVVAGIRFSAAEVAQRVADAINREAEWIRTLAYIGKHRWSGPTYDTKDDSPEVTVASERVYTFTEAESADGIETRTKDAKAAYDKAKKEYDTVYSERNDVAERIYARISEAHATIRKRERIQIEHSRYVVLAGGDLTIAARFLWKAYGSDAELIGVANPGDVVQRAEPVDPSLADEIL
jgi:hypothetical protein